MSSAVITSACRDTLVLCCEGARSERENSCSESRLRAKSEASRQSAARSAPAIEMNTSHEMYKKDHNHTNKAVSGASKMMNLILIKLVRHALQDHLQDLMSIFSCRNA